MAYMTPTNMLSIYVDVHKFHNWQQDTHTRTHTHTHDCRLFLSLCVQRVHVFCCIALRAICGLDRRMRCMCCMWFSGLPPPYPVKRFTSSVKTTLGTHVD